VLDEWAKAVEKARHSHLMPFGRNAARQSGCGVIEAGLHRCHHQYSYLIGSVPSVVLRGEAVKAGW
jgi:hypothetical protein